MWNIIVSASSNTERRLWHLAVGQSLRPRVSRERRCLSGQRQMLLSPSFHSWLVQMASCAVEHHTQDWGLQEILVKSSTCQYLSIFYIPEYLSGSNPQPFFCSVLKMYRRNRCFQSWLKSLILFSVIVPRKVWDSTGNCGVDKRKSFMQRTLLWDERSVWKVVNVRSFPFIHF